MINFTDIHLTTKTLDLYWVRKSILSALKRTLPIFKGHFLDIGCGKMPYRKLIFAESEVTRYTGLDIETARVYSDTIKPDVTWDGHTMPFEAETFDCAMATEVLEHCPDPQRVLAESYRVLRPGGCLFFTVPFLWPLHETPYDEYRYTPYALQRLAKAAGFDATEVYPTGGWNAALAQMLGLWVRRGPIPKRWRSLLSFLVFVLIKLLLRYEYTPKTFGEQAMATGFWGVLRKK